MMKYEILIAGRTDPEAHRRKEGDVVAVREAPWNWGAKEVDDYLVVCVESDEDLKAMLPGPLLDLEVTPNVMGEFPVLSKNKHQIPLDVLKDWKPDLDLGEVRNARKVYQPFLDEKITLDTKEKFALIRDKKSGKFKYSQRKGA